MKETSIFILLGITLLHASCGGDSMEEMKVDCSESNLVVTETATTVATCESLGSLEVSSSGGVGSVRYSLDENSFQASGVFDVAAGSYTVTAKDETGCTASVRINVASDGNSVVMGPPSSTDSGCGTSDGTLSVSASGGTGALSYSLNGGTPQASGTFQNLSAGNYTVTVTDEEDCSSSRDHVILTGISLDDDIMPLLVANCFGSSCHNGARGSSQDWRDKDAVINMASRIETRSLAGTMPPGAAELTQAEKDMLSCWVDDGALDN